MNKFTNGDNVRIISGPQEGLTGHVGGSVIKDGEEKVEVVFLDGAGVPTASGHPAPFDHEDFGDDDLFSEDDLELIEAAPAD